MRTGSGVVAGAVMVFFARGVFGFGGGAKGAGSTVTSETSVVVDGEFFADFLAAVLRAAGLVGVFFAARLRAGGGLPSAAAGVTGKGSSWWWLLIWDQEKRAGFAACWRIRMRVGRGFRRPLRSW